MDLLKIFASRTFLSALLLCLFISTAIAQDVIETAPVMVTSSKVEKELQDEVNSVSVITAEEIAQSAEATVGKLLQDVPGIELLNNGSQGLIRIAIRGENAFRTVILIDGQKITENKSMSGTPILISPQMIERIEVIKGPASVLYGSSAIGGVINIITKKGGNELLEAELSLQYNGAGRGFGEYLSLYGEAKDFEYRASGSFEEQGNIVLPNGIAENTQFGQQDYNAYLAYNINDNTKVGARYEYFKAHIMSGASAKPGYENFYVDVPSWVRQSATLFAESKDVASFLPKLSVNLTYQENIKEMNNHVHIDAMPLIVDNYAHNANNSWLFQFQSDWMVLDYAYLIFGYDVSYDFLNSVTKSVQSSVSTGDPFISSSVDNDGYELSNALYLSGESMLPWDFTLSYGVRYTFVNSELTRTEGTIDSLADPNAEPTLGKLGTSNSHAPVFNAGLMWQGIEDLTLRFNFAQGFRVATLSERYVPGTMGGGISIPNPDLDPETSNNFEVGARYSNYGVNLDFVYFWAIADNYIANELYDSATNTYMPRNISSAYTHGAEMQLGYDFWFGLTPFATVTYMERKFTEDGDSTYITGTPPIYGTGGLKYSNMLGGVKFYADLYARFMASYVDNELIMGSQTGNRINYPAWTTINASIGVTFGDKMQYGLYTELNNMLNHEYYLEDYIYEPGLHANVKFTAKF